MNSTQRRVKKLVDAFVVKMNKGWIADGLEKYASDDWAEHSLYVHFNEDDGSIAFDGALLDAMRCMSEFGYAEGLWNDIHGVLIKADYDHEDMGVWTKNGEVA